MRFYADESVDYPIIEALRAWEHRVLAIVDDEPALPDSEVLIRANEAESILITIDKDFGELVYLRKLSAQGVILLRLEDLTSRQKAGILLAVIEDYGATLEQAFTVISQQSVRSRPLNR